VADIKVMSAGAVQAMVSALGAEFERETGNKLDLNSTPWARCASGCKTARRPTWRSCRNPPSLRSTRSACFVPGSVIDLGRTVTGVVVKQAPAAGHFHPGGAQRRAVEGASRVLFRSGGGRLVRHLLRRLLQKLGIAEAVNKNAVLGQARLEVAQAVADGAPRSAPPSSARR